MGAQWWEHLAIHLCGLGSIPAQAIGELSLFDVLLFLLPQGF